MTNIWKIEGVNCYPERNGLPNVVFHTHWRLFSEEIVDDKVYSATCYGSLDLPLPESEGSFTPFDQLTEAQVLQWVKEALGEEIVANNEANMATQITTQKNPPVVSPALPWSN